MHGENSFSPDWIGSGDCEDVADSVELPETTKPDEGIASTETQAENPDILASVGEAEKGVEFKLVLKLTELNSELEKNLERFRRELAIYDDTGMEIYVDDEPLFASRARICAENISVLNRRNGAVEEARRALRDGNSLDGAHRILFDKERELEREMADYPQKNSN